MAAEQQKNKTKQPFKPFGRLSWLPRPNMLNEFSTFELSADSLSPGETGNQDLQVKKKKTKRKNQNNGAMAVYIIPLACGDCATRRSCLSSLPLEAQPCALMQQLWAHALLS